MYQISMFLILAHFCVIYSSACYSLVGCIRPATQKKWGSKMSEDDIRFKIEFNSCSLRIDFDHAILSHEAPVKLNAINGYGDIEILDGCRIGVVTAILRLATQPNSGVTHIKIKSHSIELSFSRAVSPSDSWDEVLKALRDIPGRTFVQI